MQDLPKAFAKLRKDITTTPKKLPLDVHSVCLRVTSAIDRALRKGDNSISGYAKQWNPLPQDGFASELRDLELQRMSVNSSENRE